LYDSNKTDKLFQLKIIYLLVFVIEEQCVLCEKKQIPEEHDFSGRLTILSVPLCDFSIKRFVLSIDFNVWKPVTRDNCYILHGSE
jgi:hypothetical protein